MSGSFGNEKARRPVGAGLRACQNVAWAGPKTNHKEKAKTVNGFPVSQLAAKNIF
jgi:hypothetical protein